MSDGEQGVMLADRGLPEYEVLRGEDVEGAIRLWRPFRRVMQVNLAEEEIAELARDADAVALPVRGREIVAVRFEF